MRWINFLSLIPYRKNLFTMSILKMKTSEFFGDNGNKFFLCKKRIQKRCILTYLHGNTKQEFIKWAEKQRKYSSNFVYLIFSFVLILIFFLHPQKISDERKKIGDRKWKRFHFLSPIIWNLFWYHRKKFLTMDCVHWNFFGDGQIFSRWSFATYIFRLYV